MKSNLLKPRYIDGEDMGPGITGEWLHIRGCKTMGFLAKWSSPDPRTIVVTDTDSVVKATKTWTFANGAFTDADIGGTFTIAGTSGAANDGTYTIATRVSATVVTSSEAVPGADETFAGTETLTLQQLDPTGDFVVETSYDGETMSASQRLVPTDNIGPNELTLTDDQIAAFPAADEGEFEFIFTKVPAPWIRFSYDPTTGGGILQVAFAGKDG